MGYGFLMDIVHLENVAVIPVHHGRLENGAFPETSDQGGVGIPSHFLHQAANHGRSRSRRSCEDASKPVQQVSPGRLDCPFVQVLVLEARDEIGTLP